MWQRSQLTSAKPITCYKAPSCTESHFDLTETFEEDFFLVCLLLVLAALGLLCCVQAFSSCGEWGLLWLWCTGVSLCRLLLLQGSKVHQLQQLWCMGLAAPRHVGSSTARDQNHVFCIGWILNHWTTRKHLKDAFLINSSLEG